MRLPFEVRSAAHRVLDRVAVRIRSGPNQGLRWSLASSGRGCLRGTFERIRVNAFMALTQPGHAVWDVGAHKGYVTLAFARRVGPYGTVTAVEPAEQNLLLLRRHLAWNRPGNVRVIEAAVSDYEGDERIGGRGSTIQFRLGVGDETVRVMRLDSLIERDGAPPPDLIKMDIKGSEADALAAAGPVLTERTILFVSVHSREVYLRTRATLLDRGFRLFESARLARTAARADRGWEDDPELLALGPASEHPDEEIRALELFATM